MNTIVFGVLIAVETGTITAVAITQMSKSIYICEFHYQIDFLISLFIRSKRAVVYRIINELQ